MPARTLAISYDQLTPRQKRLHEELLEICQWQNEPEDWIDVADVLRDSPAAEALSKVPYRGPHPLYLVPRQYQ